MTRIALFAALVVGCMPALAAAAEPGFSDSPPAAGPAIKTDRGYMVPYEETIPGTDVKFTMVPVPGGRFKLGSPETEAKREASEGPQVEVETPPFWMGRYEVTWNEYERYMDTYVPFKQLEGMRNILEFNEATLSIPDDKRETRDRLKPLFDRVRANEAEFDKLSAEDRLAVATLMRFAKEKDIILREQKKEEFALLRKQLGQRHQLTGVDAVTSPTKLYSPDQTYQDVEDKRQPAVTMTHFAARQYTKWLSKLTGRVYRLPAEAEWEYACRAGTATAYHFGDDPAQLGEYAWTFDNAEDKSHIVGQKKPNAWGLYDMHGNVGEWVLDGFEEDRYGKLPASVKAWEAISWSDKKFPHVIRGGGWDSDPERCRSAARAASGSDDDWKQTDPNRPYSPWWYTEDVARAVGMRVVRPLETHSPTDLKKSWDVTSEEQSADIIYKLTKEQRATIAAIDDTMPALLKQVEEMNKRLADIKAKYGGDDEASE